MEQMKTNALLALDCMKETLNEFLNEGTDTHSQK